MGKIYLIRHGETEANKTFQFQGHIDNPLNSKGLCQAAALGQHYEILYWTKFIQAPCSEPDRLQHLWLKLMDLLFSL